MTHNLSYKSGSVEIVLLTVILGCFLLSVSPVFAYSVDVAPVIRLNYDAGGATSKALLTVVAVDVLDNAGLRGINLYENGALAKTRDCDGTRTCTLVYFVKKTANGAFSYYATTQDVSGQTATSETRTVSYTAIPPVLSTALPDVTFDEDSSTTLNMATYFYDADNPTLQYSYQSTDAHVSASFSGTTVTITAAVNWSGVATVTIIASDGDFSVSDSLLVTVNPINDPPYLMSALPDVSFDEDASATLNLAPYFADIDSALTYTYTTTNANINVAFAGTGANFSAAADWSGTASVTIRASDGQYFIDDTTVIAINAVNDAPTATGFSVTTSEDTYVGADLSTQFLDIEDGFAGLMLSIPSENTSQVDCGITGTTLDMLPASNWNGAASCILRATDSIGLWAEMTVSINVIPVNDAPALSAVIPNQAWYQGTELRINLSQYFNDVDSSPTYSMVISPLNADMNVNLDGDMVMFTPMPEWNGTDFVQFRASDDSLSADSNLVTLTVVYNDSITMMGRVVDSVTGAGMAGKRVSFYTDTQIESKYDDPNALADYQYSEWQNLLPKSVPDAVTDINGYFYAALPDGTYNYIIQGSREDELELVVNSSKGKSHRDSDIAMTKIVLPRTGYVKVYFESASAALKSDLYMGSPDMIKMIPDSTVGASYVTDVTYVNGTEMKFFIRVNGTPWNLGVYDHWSNSTYAKVEQVDNDTWRVYFEDLPSSQADWDYNDVVALVDLIDAQYATVPSADCDSDGIPNWQDTNDNWCDYGDSNGTQVNFNAEGHVLYSGKYEKTNDSDAEGGNKYTCGQLVRFIMFGVNNGGTNETITFAVQDHTSVGGPTAPLIYTGNISNAVESLTVVAGDKAEKTFDWYIPCSLAAGRYDIHVVWNDEVWHKIGNFFVIADTAAPQINVAAGPHQDFRDTNITVGYWAGDTPTPGTIPDRVIAMSVISGVPDANIIVKVDKDIATDGPDADIITDNDADISGFGSNQEVNLTYDTSGVYTARFTATDLSGNSASVDKNITVWITEDDADAIATPYYTTLCQLDESGELRYDYTVTLGKPSPDVTTSLDMYTPIDFGGFEVGHEYNTLMDGLTSLGYTAITNVQYVNTNPEWVIAINSTTAADFESQLRNYFIWLENNGQISCPGLP